MKWKIFKINDKIWKINVKYENAIGGLGKETGNFHSGLQNPNWYENLISTI